MYWDYFEPYVSVAEKKERAQRKLTQLRKKNPGIQPIVVEGRKLAKTWWGKAWNENLERYADYSNRIGRGRSYVRQGAVLDLKITAGSVKALVQGRQASPYRVDIQIKPLAQEKWEKVITACQGEFASLQPLLNGEFPKALGEIFTERGKGLFPAPSEISFDCSCPDWAGMCKHVAAVLYGVGSRLDESPALFFTLRNLKIDDLVSQTLKTKKQNLLEKSRRKSARVIDDSDLGKLFGVEMAESRPASAGRTSPPPKPKVIATDKPAATEKPGKSRGMRTTRASGENAPASGARRTAAGRPKKRDDLKDSQLRVLKLLAVQDGCLATDGKTARKAQVGLTYLRVVLEELADQGYLNRHREGRKIRYRLFPKYRRSFGGK